MRAKRHVEEFKWAEESLANLATFVDERIDTYGCDVGLGALKRGAYMLGTMDAHYDAAPKDHPVRKTFLAKMKKGKRQLAKAQKLFERRCARQPRTPGRSRRSK